MAWNDLSYRFSGRLLSKMYQLAIFGTPTVVLHPANTSRVAGVINGWNMYFDGTTDGLSVNSFLYRVPVLANENLNGDMQLESH